jgi:beta-mannosidase
MAKIKSITGTIVVPLREGWEVASTEPDVASTPANLSRLLTWTPAAVPGTVASALAAVGKWSLGNPAPLHGQDHWFRVRFHGHGQETLRFQGLATLAEVWLNGRKILCSENMFVSHEKDVETERDNELFICFRALDPVLAKSGSAGRWRPRMISPSGLRNVRATVLGHMPGWCPSVHAVGPWRAVERVRKGPLSVASADVRATLEGTTGVLKVTLTLAEKSKHVATLSCAGKSSAMNTADGKTFTATLALPDVAAWWPHTHGTPALHKVSVSIGATIIDLGKTGFRHIEVDRGPDGRGFGLTINNEPIFCRGAVWASADITALPTGSEAFRPWLELARDAGMNMLRVPGTTIYEDQSFYELCDELGILVWQDFMFANFDYPAGDAEFTASVRREARDFLSRTQACPSLAVLCGGSEVYQQGAMLGLPPRKYMNPLFEDVLPGEVEALRPDVPYVVGSPSGGSLPFTVDAGVGHYYGVGAYLRPLEDARRANVRFASECLAFANVPADVTRAEAMAAIPAVHDPRWKARVPRDAGASWDFEDVRDHYVELLFGVSAARLRYEDADRYLALSQAVTAEVMAATFAEWQRAGSPTRGGLVLMLQDFRPGAGWGIIDSTAEPKSPWYALKRTFAPLRVTITDEGVNGLALHVANETASSRNVVLELTALRNGKTPILKAKRNIDLEGRTNETTSAYDLIGSFFDISYAYRFQAPQHDATVVRLVDRATGETLSEAFHFPLGLACTPEPAEITTTVEMDRDGWLLRLKASSVARFVNIVDESFRPSDNWFHLSPLAEKVVRLAPRRVDSANAVPFGTVNALNLRAPVAFRSPPVECRVAS